MKKIQTLPCYQHPPHLEISVMFAVNVTPSFFPNVKFTAEGVLISAFSKIVLYLRLPLRVHRGRTERKFA